MEAQPALLAEPARGWPPRALRRGAMPGSIPGPVPGPVPAAIPAAGLTPNVAGALTYLVGAITGILFLVIDPFKTDRFVRFHAFQSIFFNLAWIAFWIVWTIVGLMLGGHLAWVVLHYSAAHQFVGHGGWIVPVGLFDVHRLPGQDVPAASDRRAGGNPGGHRTRGRRPAAVDPLGILGAAALRLSRLVQYLN